ncbi:MAG: MBL fold metallo-hydrolase [Acidobacteria bacterium]|nr:MBL fold metallo-hydrolase [Acidobacteriota bacterium]
MKTTLWMSRAAMTVLPILALATPGAQAPQGQRGQAPAPAGGQPQQPVQVTTTKFGNNFYAIDGRGGRMGALVGPDGVFLVDAQFPDVTDRIVAAIRQVAPDARLRFLVNTHVHGDHTGGNENFAKLGATLLSRPMLRARLMKPSPPAPGGNPPAPAPAAALATVTYDDRTTVYMNGEGIQLIPLRDAHTDGDTAVRFPAADVLMTGDVFRSVGYPNMDRNNGGTLKGMLAALSLLVDTAGPNTTVVPGHGPITNRAAIIAHRDMAVAVRDRVSKLLSQGQTIEQVVAAKPTADFDERVGNAAQSADRFVQQVYAELRGPAPR